jgi:hypothetical protein
MYHNELCQRVFKVPLVGAPCAGKTTVTASLENIFQEENQTDRLPCRYITVPGTWSSFASFAALLFNAYGQEVKPSREALKDTLQNTEDNNGAHLLTSYETLGLQFLDLFQHVNTEKELRLLFQLELVQIELQQEYTATQEAKKLHDERATVLVIDSGTPVYLTYKRGLPHEEVAKRYKKYGMPLPFMMNALDYHDAVVFMETLATLNDPALINPLFYDGRRLDSPIEARNIHRRIYDYIGCAISRMPVYHFLATDSLEYKKERIYEILTRDLLEKWYFRLPEASQRIVEARG